jgi:hypothetical protein
MLLDYFAAFSFPSVVQCSACLFCDEPLLASLSGCDIAQRNRRGSQYSTGWWSHEFPSLEFHAHLVDGPPSLINRTSSSPPCDLSN